MNAAKYGYLPFLTSPLTVEIDGFRSIAAETAHQ